VGFEAVAGFLADVLAGGLRATAPRDFADRDGVYLEEFDLSGVLRSVSQANKSMDNARVQIVYWKERVI